MQFPVDVINGGKTPYTGTVITGVPFSKGLGYTDIDVVGFDVATGRSFPAATQVITRHDDGSAAWVLIGVTGTFAPGKTKVDIAPNWGGVRDPWFTPQRWNIFQGCRVSVIYALPGTTVMKSAVLDLSSILSSNFTVHQGTEVFMRVEASGVIDGNFGWRVFVDARRDEPGIRFELQFENRGKGLFDGGKPIIIKSAKLSVNEFISPTPSTIDLPYGKPATSMAVSMGSLKIPFGDKLGPIKMSYSNAQVICDFIQPSSAIPQGGNYALPALPGSPLTVPADPQQDPTSVLGLFLYEKINFRFFLGGDLPQEHLDCPPQLLWSDCERYDRAIIGGVVAEGTLKDASGAFVPTTPSRFDRVMKSFIDPAMCDPQNGAERITYRQFIERGGTYPIAPNLNPHYGIRNWGDSTWGDGYAGANHYDVTHSLLRQFIRSGDFRWFYEADVKLFHYRTWDVSWAANPSGPSVQNKFEGYSLYEKGHHHGNYTLPLMTHTWIGGPALMYCLSGHPEYLRLCQQTMDTCIKNNSLDGAPVPSTWAIGTSKDPRDWATPAGRTNLRGTTIASSPVGWYGDFGIRTVRGVCEAAAANAVYLKSVVGYDVDTYFDRILTNVARVENQWGGHGYILNRSFRENYYYDYEQGWMHSDVVRGLGYAMMYASSSVAQKHRAMYDRFFSWLKNLVVGGDKDGLNQWSQPRLAAAFDESGPIVTIMAGLSIPTQNAWYAYRVVPSDKAKFMDWYNKVQADITVLNSYASPSGQTAWVLRKPDFVSFRTVIDRLKTKFDAGTLVDANDPDYAFCLSKQWYFDEQLMYPNVNHAMMGANALAQGALELTSDPVAEVMALRMAELCVWHLQDASVGYYKDIRHSPSVVAYRMGMYPNSETKVIGNQLESFYARRIVELLNNLSAPVWAPTITDLPNEVVINPWPVISQEAAAALSTEGTSSPFVVDPNYANASIVSTPSLILGYSAPPTT